MRVLPASSQINTSRAPKWRFRNGYDIPGESSANRKRSGFHGGISPVKFSSRNSLAQPLEGWSRSFEELDSELGSSLLETSDVSSTLLNLVELCSAVDEFGPVTEDAIDQTGKLAAMALMATRNGLRDSSDSFVGC
jgi:hypothetical protein